MNARMASPQSALAASELDEDPFFRNE